MNERKWFKDAHKAFEATEDTDILREYLIDWLSLMRRSANETVPVHLDERQLNILIDALN